MTAKLHTVIQILCEEQQINYCLVSLLLMFCFSTLWGERLRPGAWFLLRAVDSTAQAISDQRKARSPKLRLVRSSHVRAQCCQSTCSLPTKPRSKKPNQKDTK